MNEEQNSRGVPSEQTRKQKITASNLLSSGTTQVGLMAALVTAVVQPFAQPKILSAFQLPAVFPLYMAIAVSFLLALYHVCTLQKIKVIEYIILIPLATCIIFSTALGSNNLLGEHNDQNVNQEMIDNLNKKLENSEELLRFFGVDIDSEDAGLGVTLDNQLGQHSDHPNNDFFSDLLGFFVGDVYAQESYEENVSPPDFLESTNNEEQSKAEAIRKYLEIQNQLNEEAQQINEKRQQESDLGLWKKW
jgi:hypothetical protein